MTLSEILNDEDASYVHRNLEIVLGFYKDVFSHDSFDGKGRTVKAWIHYFFDNMAYEYLEAKWKLNKVMYGDPLEPYFKSFTIDIEVTGHEFTHGVIQSFGKLNDFNSPLKQAAQTRALNESYADVFGLLSFHYHHNLKVEKDSWLIGRNIFPTQKIGLRSMSKPGTAYQNHFYLLDDPQVDNWSGFNEKKGNDKGHYNSGIPNKAFYLVATTIGGYSWEVAGKIWFEALKLLPKNAIFMDLKEKTIEVANAQFSTHTGKLIADCWEDVGVKK